MTIENLFPTTVLRILQIVVTCMNLLLQNL